MRVHCESSGPTPPLGWTVIKVTSINDGADPTTWPVRLHPAEATISFIVDGVRHRGVEQVDSVVETVTLDPGQAISTGVLMSVGDRGPVLPDAGGIDLQVAVRPPGPAEETVSNHIEIRVVEDEAAAGRSRALRALDSAATAVRDGAESDTADVVAALRALPDAHRAWAATALLPAAPLPDDPLLEAARRVRLSAATPDPIAEFVVAGVPHARWAHITE